MIPIRDTIPASRTPVVMFALILVNALIFLFEWRLPPGLLQNLIASFGLVPARDAAFPVEWTFAAISQQYLPFFTTMFLHGSWFHLLSNMWSLWLFGDNVEDRMGPWRFLTFYLVCGLSSAFLHVALNSQSDLPAVGASGAISGVMGAYLMMFPTSRLLMFTILIFYPIVFEIPAVIFLIFWFLGQLLSGTVALGMGTDGGGIAFWAHIGGFVAGMFLYRAFLPRTRPRWRLSEQSRAFS